MRPAELAAALGLKPAQKFDLFSSLPSFMSHSRAGHATQFDSEGRISIAPNSLLVNNELTGGVSGTVGVDAVAPTSWGFINSGGSVTFAGNTVRFQATAGRPALGQTIAAAQGCTYVQEFRVVAIGSATIVQDVSNPGALPSGASIAFYANGNAVSGTYQLQAGDVIQMVLTIGTTAGNPQLRIGLGAGVPNTGDITIGDIHAYLALPSRRTQKRIVTTSAAYYAPRFECAPVTKLPLGLLMEGQSSNQLTATEKVQGNVAGSTVAGPEWNGWRMTRYTADPSSQAHGTLFDTPVTTPAGSSRVTVSCVVKHISGSTFVQLTGSGSWVALPIAESYANFDLATGQVVQVGTLAENAQIVPVGDGYFRISVVLQTSASPSVATGGVLFSCLTGTEQRAPNLTLSQVLDIGLPQHEPGNSLTSYMPTYGSAVVRAADTLSGPTAGWYNSVQGTVVVEWLRSNIPVSSLSYNPIIAMLRNVVTTRMNVMAGSGTPAQQRWDIADGGVSQAALAAASGVAGQVYRIAATYAANDFRMSQNGSAVVTDSSGTVPQGITTLELGSYSAASPLNGHVRSFRYYNTALTNAQLQRLSA